MTIEAKLKVLPTGRNGLNLHTIRIMRGDQSRKVLVDVRPNRAVWVLPEPKPEDMYTSWRKLKGDSFTDVGAVVVWASRSDTFNAMYAEAFAREPVLSIQL